MPEVFDPLRPPESPPDVHGILFGLVFFVHLFQVFYP